MYVCFIPTLYDSKSKCPLLYPDLLPEVSPLPSSFRKKGWSFKIEIYIVICLDTCIFI